jgi:hypothetical protein
MTRRVFVCLPAASAGTSLAQFTGKRHAILISIDGFAAYALKNPEVAVPNIRALNYFKARKEFSSGVVEGLNNKAKVTMRKSYGFRSFRILELAIYHALGKLPEPELTHEFF